MASYLDRGTLEKMAIPYDFWVGSSFLWRLVAAAGFLTALYLATAAFYNVFLHPLRHVPGPLHRRVSTLPWALANVRGQQAFHTQRLHDRYGPVVRLSPNHVSFTKPSAWRDIYGHRAGQGEMAKIFTFRDNPRSILTAERAEHSRLRRGLSHGFSDTAMRGQEPIIRAHVDLLMRRLREACVKGDGTSTQSMEVWYNWTTFDIIGSLVFGQSFGCLENVAYHTWIEFFLGGLHAAAWLDAAAYVGLTPLAAFVFRHGGGAAAGAARKSAAGMVEYRLQMEKGQNDLFEGIISRRDELNLDFARIVGNGNLLVSAGSETTATVLSGVTYLVLSHPHVYDRLKREVRTAFARESDINFASASQLTYMLAVINEGLRMYPPVAAGIPRIVPEPGEYIAGYFMPAGAKVEVQHWAMNHSSENYADPWKFNPDRFLDSPEKALEAGNTLEALQPFNLGPRNCIGRNLAYAELRLILALLVYKFDMTLADESHDWIKRQNSFLFWEKIPLRVHLVPRDAK